MGDIKKRQRKPQLAPNLHEETRPDGAVIQAWAVRCGDCDFISGLAEVRWPDGSGCLLTGAGCFTRRSPEKTLEWTRGVQKPSGGQ